MVCFQRKQVAFSLDQNSALAIQTEFPIFKNQNSAEIIKLPNRDGIETEARINEQKINKTTAEVNPWMDFVERAKELEQVYETLPDLVFWLDSNGIITKTNSHTDRFFGREGMIGRSFEKYTHPEDLDSLNKFVRNTAKKALKNGHKIDKNSNCYRIPVKGHNYRIIKDTGEVIWVELSAILLLGPNKEKMGFNGSLKDITHEIELAEKLKSMVLLAGHMSHEIKNPLINMVGCSVKSLHLLKKMKVLNDELKVSLKVGNILRAQEIAKENDQIIDDLTFLAKDSKRYAQHVERINKDIMNWFKFENGKMVIEKKEKNIYDAIYGAYRFFVDQAKDQGIKLKVNNNQKIDSLLMPIDETWILQVFANIIKNSLKFTDRGGSITVDVDQKDDQLIVAIKDTGVGIPQDRLQNIFDVLNQVHYDNNDGRSKNDGVGLGLYIVKNVVDEHGGEISVESEVGKGTIFTVTLPLMQN